MGEIDWVTKGALGALLGVGDEALVSTLAAFAVQLGYSDEEALAQAKSFLPGYKAFLKSEGVANA
jgi:hypothetical protein